MRIAILGTRGIPAKYGGFETFAEELSWRLAERGHRVTVYCRVNPETKVYRGVQLTYLPTIRHKYLDTLAHTFLSTLHLVLHRTDVALYCNAANAIFTGLPGILGIPVALNVDGIERKRRKWNGMAKAWYFLSERIATVLPRTVVSDARVIQDYYLSRYKKKTTFIAYGADTEPVTTVEVLGQLGLAKQQYFLYVSRFEPENHPLMVRRAFESVQTSMRLALIGDAPHARDYIAQVRATDDPRIVIPGAIYGQGYRELGQWCFAYIHATEVGGTHPALIEAMGLGALVLYRNTPENAEVCGDCGLRFDTEAELAEKIRFTLAMEETDRAQYRLRALGRVRERYSWAAVTSQYERLFTEISRH